MEKALQNERRAAPRYPALSEQMVEFNIPSALVYQLKCQDISERGAGIVVKPNSKFLDLIKVDQPLKVKLLSLLVLSPPRASTKSGLPISLNQKMVGSKGTWS